MKKTGSLIQAGALLKEGTSTEKEELGTARYDVFRVARRKAKSRDGRRERESDKPAEEKRREGEGETLLRRCAREKSVPKSPGSLKSPARGRGDRERCEGEMRASELDRGGGRWERTEKDPVRDPGMRTDILFN